MRTTENDCCWKVVQGQWFRVQGSGCMVQGAGFRVHGSGCRVQGAWPVVCRWWATWRQVAHLMWIHIRCHSKFKTNKFWITMVKLWSLGPKRSWLVQLKYCVVFFIDFPFEIRPVFVWGRSRSKMHQRRGVPSLLLSDLFMVQGSGFRVQGSGFRIENWGWGLMVQRSGQRVAVYGWGVRGLGLRSWILRPLSSKEGAT